MNRNDPNPLLDQLQVLRKEYRDRIWTSGISLRELLLERERISPSGGRVVEIDAAFEQAQSIVESPVCPIVAVLGMLNAGKSSLVATYLNADGNSGVRRVLIGSANTEGTHRFVLWLPESWKSNSVIWGYLSRRLSEVFGCIPEELSQDPAQASLQYNDLSTRDVPIANGVASSPDRTQKGDRPPNLARRSALEVPLIATDPSLDRLGIALMDCPDIQTGLMSGWDQSNTHRGSRWDELSAAASESRFTVLERASAICSAFVVVLPANAMHDQTVSRLLKMLEARMPHVQRILAVNRVPRKYDAKEIGEEMRSLYSHSQPSRIYMAYHFDGPERRDKLQSLPKEFSGSNELSLPAFFRIDQTPVPQPPETIPESAWMLRLGEQLQGSTLLSDAIESALTSLKIALTRGLQSAQDWLEESNRRLREAHRLLAQACLDFSLDPNAPPHAPKIRLQASRQVIEQIAQSLEKTAPWWARPGRWVQRIAQVSKDSVGQATSWMKMPSWMMDRGNAVGDWARSKLKRGENGKVVTADALCDALAQRDREGIFGMDQDDTVRQSIRNACQNAIARFQAESSTKLDPEQVDQLTKRLWDEMPIGKRILSGVAPAGILFAPLLAVIMIPLDFGGSSVLVFASLKELLFAGAAGFGLVLASNNTMPQLAESESAWQQLSDLVAVLTDELGLKRPVHESARSIPLGNTARNLATSNIPEKTASATCIPGIPREERGHPQDTYAAVRHQLDQLRQAEQSLQP